MTVVNFPTELGLKNDAKRVIKPSCFLYAVCSDTLYGRKDFYQLSLSYFAYRDNLDLKSTDDYAKAVGEMMKSIQLN